MASSGKKPIETVKEGIDGAEKELVHENTLEAKQAWEKKLGAHVERVTLTMSNVLQLKCGSTGLPLPMTISSRKWRLSRVQSTTDGNRYFVASSMFLCLHLQVSHVLRVV